MLIEEYISWEKFLLNNCLSFGLWKCGESHMTYLARNTVKTGFRHTPQNDWALEKYLKYSCVIIYLTAWAQNHLQGYRMWRHLQAVPTCRRKCVNRAESSCLLQPAQTETKQFLRILWFDDAFNFFSFFLKIKSFNHCELYNTVADSTETPRFLYD